MSMLHVRFWFEFRQEIPSIEHFWTLHLISYEERIWMVIIYYILHLFVYTKFIFDQIEFPDISHIQNFFFEDVSRKEKHIVSILDTLRFV